MVVDTTKNCKPFLLCDIPLVRGDCGGCVVIPLVRGDCGGCVVIPLVRGTCGDCVDIPLSVEVIVELWL